MTFCLTLEPPRPFQKLPCLALRLQLTSSHLSSTQQLRGAASMVTGARRMGGGVAKAPLAAPTPFSLPCSHSEFSPRLEPALNSWITEGATEQQQRQLQKPVALLLSVPCTCNSALRHHKPLTHIISHILPTFTHADTHTTPYTHTHTQAHLYTKTHTHSYTCKTSHTHKQHTQAIRQMHKYTSSHKRGS